MDPIKITSQDIIGLLKEHSINDVNVVFHESKVQLLTGHLLLEPANDDNHLKNIIHSITTALSLPITGEKMLKSQEILGFYFCIGKDLQCYSTPCVV